MNEQHALPALLLALPWPVQILIGLLALASGVFAVVAAVGIVRFPDALSRMHAASKAGSFAGALALIAAAIGFGTLTAWITALVAILFIFLTAPVGAHLLARAAHWREGGRTPSEFKQ